MANNNNRSITSITSIARFVNTSIVALVAATGLFLSTESAAFAHRAGPLHRTPVVAVNAGDDFSDVAVSTSNASAGATRTPRAAKTRRAQASYVTRSERN